MTLSSITIPFVIRDWDALMMPADTYPVREIDALRDQFPSQRLFAYYGYGGLVIYRARGALPLFIDGRSTNAYAPATLKDGYRVQEMGEGFERILKDAGVTLLLFPKDHPIHARLAQSGEWQVATDGLVAKGWVRVAVAHP